MQYIDLDRELTKEGSAESFYILKSDCLDFDQILTFVELMNLKEEIDQLVSDEQSRLLSQSLLGD